MSGVDHRAAAAAWLAIDPDPATRAEVRGLLDAGDDAGLADRFASRLTFGTAGLRGAEGAGPNRMNRVVVMQTSAGLARFLTRREPVPSAVVGHDARHGSAAFARDAAGVLAAAGVRVVLLPRALPTPLLAFAVRDLGFGAGVMITASHNPAADNGYKLYLGGADGGSQLVAPDDAAVQAEIEAVVETGRLPRSDGPVELADEDLIERYLAAAAVIGAAARGSAVRWAYTPMHGVGLETVSRVAARAGLPAPIVVAEQAEPDPDFPTVAFPNPEEPGALDLGIRLAEHSRADLLIATDPDADRMAVAVPDGARWRQLTGNEVGLLLAWEVAAAGTTGVLACSIVSTPGLAAIAAHFGLRAAETLTGFKWISRVPELAYGFEEAIGYLVDPASVRDKDGVSAAMAVLATASALRADGRTLLDRLAEIEGAIGRFASAQVSVRSDDAGALTRTMARLRADPPTRLGGLAVLAVDDLRDGGPLPPTDGVRLTLERDARVIVRPSGTEPKVKAYLDVVVRDGAPDARAATATELLAALSADVRRLLA